VNRKILIMGLPGAGKTTLANALAPLLNAVVFSADLRTELHSSYLQNRCLSKTAHFGLAMHRGVRCGAQPAKKNGQQKTGSLAENSALAVRAKGFP
jgi:DNA helicase TIP49 (TBP-interacting protein)